MSNSGPKRLISRCLITSSLALDVIFVFTIEHINLLAINISIKQISSQYTQLVKKFHTFRGTRRFIAFLFSQRPPLTPPSLSWVSQMSSTRIWIISRKVNVGFTLSSTPMIQNIVCFFQLNLPGFIVAVPSNCDTHRAPLITKPFNDQQQVL
jgi:hypothetical protein